MAAIKDIKTDLRRLLRSVPGTTTVETKPGGQVPWAKAARPKQSFWWIHITGWQWQERGRPIGGTGSRMINVEIQGWMPRSYDNPDTSVTWDTLLQAVCNKFRDNRSLYATVNDMSLPNVPRNDFEYLGDGKSDPVECHHCTLTVTIDDYQTYTTS